MPRTYDDEWVKKWLDEWPPECYKMTVFEAAGFLGYGEGVLYALATCCNYGFQRGQNFERNAAKRKRLSRKNDFRRLSPLFPKTQKSLPAGSGKEWIHHNNSDSFIDFTNNT